MLRAAAIAGDLKRMKQLIDNGVDPNGSNYDNRTAFHLAAAAGKLEVLYYLLAVGRGSYSSTLQLNVSTACGIRWGHGFPPVY